MYRIALAAFVSICAIAGAQAQTPLGGTIPVTVDNIVRAETDNYFATKYEGWRSRQAYPSRPRATILNGTWKFPEPIPAS